METLIVITVFVVVLAVLFWVAGYVIAEAERKLGRELTFAEIFLGGMTTPYSIIYILWVMPEPKPPGRTHH